MLTQLAALSIGLITTVAAPVALAAPCDRNYPTSYPTTSYPTTSYPTYGAPVPSYGPVPTYAPAPPYAPHAAPRPQPRRFDSQQAVMRRADYNRDGFVTFAEAQAYGRNQFARADEDRNGVLTRWELQRSRDDYFTRVSHGQGRVVTLAEFDSAVYDQFSQLDHNRDGFLNRYELGLGAAPPPSNRVTWSWNWSL